MLMGVLEPAPPAAPSLPPTRSRAGSRLGVGQGVLVGLAVGCALAVLAAYLGKVRAPESVLLAVIGLCGVAGAFRITRLLLTWGAGLLAALLCVCLLTPILRGPLSALTLAQPPTKADAIVVLGGGVQCGTRTLEPTSFARLMRGLELWRAGYAPVITVSEQSNLLGSPTCPKMSVLEGEIVRQLYPQGGPELLTLRSVTTTRDEAARVRDYARERGWQSILLVTSPSHSRRAAALFEAYGLRAVSVPAQELQFDTTLPLPSDRLEALQVVLYEWLSRAKSAAGGTPER